MRLRNREIHRFIKHALLLAVWFFLQAVILPYLPIRGVKPLIFPMLVLGVALFEGQLNGAVFGLFAGILCDLSLNDPPIVFTIFLTVAGFGAGMLFDKVMTRGFPSFFVCSLGILLLSAFIQAFRPIVFAEVPVEALLPAILIQTAYSLIFSFPAYVSARAVSRQRG